MEIPFLLVRSLSLAARTNPLQGNVRTRHIWLGRAQRSSKKKRFVSRLSRSIGADCPRSVLPKRNRPSPRVARSWRRPAPAPRLSTSRLRATGGTRRAMLKVVFHAFVRFALSADRRIAEQMIACLYALPRTEPLTPLSQTHSGTKWFGKPSPGRSSVGASSSWIAP